MALDIEPGIAAEGNPALIKIIIKEMDGGTIPFERFMELALYHPEHGYYRKSGRIGSQGDFLTSPAIHPMFGWAIASWCEWIWQQLDEPDTFTIFEPGAGEGALGSAILDWAEARENNFSQSLRYIALEPNTEGTDSRIQWLQENPSPVLNGIVLANELFDALPTRLFEATERGPAEIHVRWDGNNFVEVRGNITVLQNVPNKGRFEINGKAWPLLETMCGLIKQGGILLADYGYEEEKLWAPWRLQGTLSCFYRHTAHENPYRHVGEQDITAHVNLSELETGLQNLGYEQLGPIPQHEFLTKLGIGNLVESARTDLGNYFERRQAFQALTDAGGLGKIQILAGLRGIKGTAPGFEGDKTYE